MKTRIDETNYMRRLMGLPILTEDADSKEEQEKSEFKQPEFKGISNLNFSDGKLLVTVNIQNPSRLNLKIKDYDIDILMDGNNIAKVKMEGETVILKKGGEITSMVIPIKLDMNSNFIVNLLKDSIISPNKEHKLKLDGFLKGGIFIFSKKIPLSQEKTFKINELKSHKSMFDYLTGDAKKTIDNAKKEIENVKKSADKSIEKGKEVIDKTIEKGKEIYNNIGNIFN